ncbi:hypothetical protein PPYR_05526 [Photinus pyralis]|uniref:Lipid-binding serum glycoprotein N-terminal domain-containing protein n=1 Tax=Photinus pyralis TaxID=7054 RepID=A0A1Y1KWR1_PHOPY|nr:uncharacterized protein LOC116165468 [Photinus pyralis]KAB0801172.1 hypothetical protein PPYR_05526 [Photinus pyralis]
MSWLIRVGLLMYLYNALSVCALAEDADGENIDTFQLGEKKISEFVREIIEHYKQEDPIGIPGVPIPEPLDIPPLTHSFSVGRMNFENVKLYGLPKFRIDHVTADLAKMQVTAALRIDVLNVLGNYTLSTWLSRSQGPFTVQLSDVYVEAIAKLEVDDEGRLEAQDMNMDITFKNIAMNFERLGFFASVFQGVINSVGTFIFDSIKPFILSEVNTNMRNDVNKQVHQIPLKFPNSISPFDKLLSEARSKVRELNYDPFMLDDYNYTATLFTLDMTHTWLTGLSTFHRVGNMTFEVRNHSLYLSVEVGTQQLKGTTHWEVGVVGGVMSRAGTASFSVEYLKVGFEVSQSMDTRNSPQLNDLQLELGNIQVRCDGAGTLDYIIEFAVNVIPNLLRFQIMDAIESPLRSRVQEILSRINVEKTIHENLPVLDHHQETGFKGLLI